MAKKYFDNYKLTIAIEYLFGSIKVNECLPIHDVINLESGDTLPKNQMKEGNYYVYGGGGKTENQHSKFNLDFDTIGIGRVGARFGCVFNIEKKSWVTDNLLYVKGFDKRFSLNFLKHFLSYSNLNKYANNAMQPVISKTGIQSINIPILEYEKQVEIGNFIDEIENNNFINIAKFPLLKEKFSLLDKIDIINEENHVQFLLLNKLKQSILQEAIQGKLTTEWRKQNPNTESAIELLKRIKVEKEKLIKEKKIKKENPLPPIAKEETHFELPKGWTWCRLGGIIEMIYGDSLTKNQCIEGAEFPVFGSNGIVGYYNKYNTSKRAIIIGRKGSAGAINICQTPSWTTDVAYYVEESNHLNFIFTYYLLMSLQLEKLGKGIKPGVNRNEAYNVIIPLPPLAEQKIIVEKVEY